MGLSAATIQSRLITTGLPTFPRTVAKLEHLIVTAEAPAQVVASVIATDPALTALIIGQANAAGHATSQLTEAIRRIGMGVVLNISRSAVPVPDAQRSILAALWAQANAVAVMVPILVNLRRQHLRGRWDDETLHVIGLVHDLGHVIAVSHFPREYEQASRRLQSGEEGFSRLLGEEIGLDPGALAALSAAHWAVPAPLLPAMAWWRRPGEAGEHSELAAIVHIAHGLVHAAGFVAGGDRWVEALDERALSLLDLRISDLETLINQLYGDMEELELYEGALGAG